MILAWTRRREDRWTAVPSGAPEREGGVPAPGRDEPSPRTQAAGSPRVLIVEDEAIIAWELATIVERFGCEVCGTAMSAGEAERLADRTEPQVILMDVRLGRGDDGIVAAGRIRAKRPVPIIFCTAFADPPTVARMNAVGAAGILSKPIRPADLEALIRGVVRAH